MLAGPWVRSGRGPDCGRALLAGPAWVQAGLPGQGTNRTGAGRSAPGPGTAAGSTGQERNYGYGEDLAEGVSVSNRLAKELPDWSPETSSGAGLRRYLDWLKEAV